MLAAARSATFCSPPRSPPSIVAAAARFAPPQLPRHGAHRTRSVALLLFPPKLLPPSREPRARAGEPLAARRACEPLCQLLPRARVHGLLPSSASPCSSLRSRCALILLSPSPLHRSLWSSPCCPGVCLVPLSVPLEDLHIFELMVGAHGTRIMCGMLWLGGGLQWHSVRSLSPQVLSRGARGRRGPAQLLAPQLMRWRRCCAADNQQHALGARSAPHGACAALTADMPPQMHPDSRRYLSTRTTAVGRQAHSDAWAASWELATQHYNGAL